MMDKNDILMKKENDFRRTTTLDLTLVGLMAALTFIATSVIHIPSYMGVVHLGDSVVFLAAILLGKKRGAIASAIGMCLFDVMNGYFFWAPFTFVIKGMMAYIAGMIAYRGGYNGKSLLNNLFAFIVGGIFMIVAYYFSGVLICRFVISTAATLQQGLIIAAKDIPSNILQVVAGIAIAIPLSYLLVNNKAISRYIYK